jgi:uncharacterized protein (DUF885 family)
MERQKARLTKLGGDYFDFMAGAYPVISLSDEFYFFPRARKAIQYLNRLDSFDKEKIKQNISYIKALKQNLEALNTGRMELEDQIDCQLLRQSMAAFLQETEQIKAWQSDPNIYLKIIILGIEQIITKLSMLKTDIRQELICRTGQIPRLLKEAKANLRKISLPSRQTAIRMAEAIIGYLKNRYRLPLNRKSTPAELIKLNRKAIESLEDFKGFLRNQSGRENFIKSKEALQALLINCFSYKRPLAEMFEIAADEYRRISAELKKTAGHIRATASWQGILSDYKLKVRNKTGLLNLYSGQISCLKDFLRKNELLSIPDIQNIKVLETPDYLKPIRASASYNCPLSRRQAESALFYVTADRIKENIHQEYIFVSAHETFPGHHLLDSIRRTIKNPIRQQIESALFYEGWASYAEGLIEEFGYLNNPQQRLIGLRRQAWRAIRAKLDIGITINKIKPSQAAEELCWLGYSPPSVKAMLKHYLLTYGYQLCYTIGKFEIERLRKRFAARMGTRNFHDCLLKGGELPFDLIGKRMEKICRRDS